MSDYLRQDAIRNARRERKSTGPSTAFVLLLMLVVTLVLVALSAAFDGDRSGGGTSVTSTRREARPAQPLTPREQIAQTERPRLLDQTMASWSTASTEDKSRACAFVVHGMAAIKDRTLTLEQSLPMSYGLLVGLNATLEGDPEGARVIMRMRVDDVMTMIMAMTPQNYALLK